MVPNYRVYIMASKTHCTYVGVTNDLMRRWAQHRSGTGSAHCARYHITHLVHVEEYADVREAIAREKRLKKWSRARKVALVSEHNPDWHDLAVEWGWHKAVV